MDFQELTKDQISSLKDTQENLVKLVQESINQATLDYEVRLYGSHATNLCLPWSDIDLVLIPLKNNNYSYPCSALQKLYYTINVTCFLMKIG